MASEKPPPVPALAHLDGLVAVALKLQRSSDEIEAFAEHARRDLAAAVAAGDIHDETVQRKAGDARARLDLCPPRAAIVARELRAAWRNLRAGWDEIRDGWAWFTLIKLDAEKGDNYDLSRVNLRASNQQPLGSEPAAQIPRLKAFAREVRTACKQFSWPEPTLDDFKAAIQAERNRRLALAKKRNIT